MMRSTNTFQLAELYRTDREVVDDIFLLGFLRHCCSVSPQFGMEFFRVSQWVTSGRGIMACNFCLVISAYLLPYLD